MSSCSMGSKPSAVSDRRTHLTSTDATELIMKSLYLPMLKKSGLSSEFRLTRANGDFPALLTYIHNNTQMLRT